MRNFPDKGKDAEEFFRRSFEIQIESLGGKVLPDNAVCVDFGCGTGMDFCFCFLFCYFVVFSAILSFFVCFYFSSILSFLSALLLFTLFYCFYYCIALLFCFICIYKCSYMSFHFIFRLLLTISFSLILFSFFSSVTLHLYFLPSPFPLSITLAFYSHFI